MVGTGLLLKVRTVFTFKLQLPSPWSSKSQILPLVLLTGCDRFGHWLVHLPMNYQIPPSRVFPVTKCPIVLGGLYAYVRDESLSEGWWHLDLSKFCHFQVQGVCSLVWLEMLIPHRLWMGYLSLWWKTDPSIHDGGNCYDGLISAIREMYSFSKTKRHRLGSCGYFLRTIGGKCLFCLPYVSFCLSSSSIENECWSTVQVTPSSDKTCKVCFLWAVRRTKSTVCFNVSCFNDKRGLSGRLM